MNKSYAVHLPIRKKDFIVVLTETVGGTSVSSGCWGEDSNHELAGAAHFHVASPAPSFLNRNLFHLRFNKINNLS